MKILGVSCYYHDSAAALIADGNIVAAAQEERFSRVKGDENFPYRAIQYCLAEAKLNITDIDAIVFYEKPLLKFERIVETFLNTAPNGLKVFLTALPMWLHKKLNHKKLLKSEFKRHFDFVPKNILFDQHHHSHAASAFYPSPFEKAAILCIDGVGEWATTSAWAGHGNKIESLWQINFPHSLGLLYSTFTLYCGFKINSGEYKLMGLAPFGQPIYVNLIKENLITLNSDGSFWLNTAYFGYLDSLDSINYRFTDLFGHPARAPEQPLTDFYKDIAASVQSVLNEAVINLAKRIKKDTRAENLCLAGGVALNCVANGLLAKLNLFKNIWIQPAAGDAGGALGAALAYYYEVTAKERTPNPSDQMQNSFLGPCYSDPQIEAALTEAGLNFKKLSAAELLQSISVSLAENQIVGWFQGRMEFGPRALGGRSILGNPLTKDMKSKMNIKIKFREGFRPFAPIVTAEAYEKYFTLANKNEYMLLVSEVVSPSLMPAITHVDFSARVQTIYKEKNQKLHHLLKAFEDLTGHPVLINTSFNIRGEPIVCTPQNAINCFINTDIDILVLENYVVEKKENLNLIRDEAWRDQFALD